MNEYTPFNTNMFNNMHPPITMPNGYDITFSYSLSEFNSPYDSSNGYKVYL